MTTPKEVMQSHQRVFDLVAQGKITSEDGADWMMGVRWRENYERLYRTYGMWILINTVGWVVFAISAAWKK